jgi:hypothetical protein
MLKKVTIHNTLQLGQEAWPGIMDTITYWVWVLLAVVGGVIANIGVIIQKKVVNSVSEKDREKHFYRTLVKSPLWLFGFVIGVIAPAVFIIGANMFIGPALVPGLVNSGLIVLAVGSVRINRERLGVLDFVGIVLMVVAIASLGLSQLSIAMVGWDYNESWFLFNTVLFTVVLFVFCAVFVALEISGVGNRGILLIFASGFMLLLSNFWVAPLSGTIIDVFAGVATTSEWVFFVLSCVLTSVGAIFSTASQQSAFKYGRASTLTTLQQVPTQLAPAFIYLMVFELSPQLWYSLPLLFAGTALMFVSFYLLAGRKVEVSEKK